MALLATHSRGATGPPSVDATARRRYCAGAFQRLTVVIACCAILFANCQMADGDAQSSEYAVKAAFVFNFANFVEWPTASFESADSPIVIGIVGRDSFGGALDRIVQGKSVNRHGFVVKRLHWGTDLRTCHILFVSASESDGAERVAAATRGGSVLAVGETPGFASHGGVINFTLDEGHLRFEINPDAARRAHLAISSRLLSLAKIVSDAK